MKLYAVELNSGQYSDTHTWVESIFDSKQGAEAWAAHINSWYEKMKSWEMPEEMRLEYESLEAGRKDQKWDDVPREIQERLQTFWSLDNRYQYQDFNGAQVLEFILNDKNAKYLQP